MTSTSQELNCSICRFLYVKKFQKKNLCGNLYMAIIVKFYSFLFQVEIKKKYYWHCCLSPSNGHRRHLPYFYRFRCHYPLLSSICLNKAVIGKPFLNFPLYLWYVGMHLFGTERGICYHILGHNRGWGLLTRRRWNLTRTGIWS